jgi:beta-galactosidase
VQVLRHPQPLLTRAPPRLLSPDPPGRLTVTASLAADTPWAPAGHEIAFAQAQVAHPAPTPPPALPAPPAIQPAPPGCAVLGDDTGELRRLGPFPVHSAALDFWRAPTDNDALTIARAWRRAGLDRLEQRIIAVEPGEEGLRTRLRIAPAGADFAFLATSPGPTRRPRACCPSTSPPTAPGPACCRRSACGSCSTPPSRR